MHAIGEHLCRQGLWKLPVHYLAPVVGIATLEQAAAPCQRHQVLQQVISVQVELEIPGNEIQVPCDDRLYLLTQLRKYKKGIRPSDRTKDPVGAAMIGLVAIFKDEQSMKDVIAYVQSLAE